MITLDEVERALPANLKSSASQNLVDTINNIAADPLIAEQIRENFVSYTGILKEGRFKTDDYLHAVAFVSYKLMGNTNKEAYMKTFSARFTALIAKGTSDKDISSYVSAYARGKLVNLVLEQSLVPTWVLNQDMYQKALNTQADLMINATSEKVRTDAANSILTHLKKPETGKFQLDVNVKDNSGITELKEAMVQLAHQQQAAIRAGMPTSQVAAQQIIDGEAVEVTK